MMCRAKRGQAALEYVLVFAGLLIVMSVVGTLVWTAMRQSERATALVSSEYP